MVLIRQRGLPATVWRPGAGMIDISERAQQHFLRLLSQQGSEGLGFHDLWLREGGRNLRLEPMLRMAF